MINATTIQVNLAIPDGAFINQMFDSIPNWIVSETSFNKMGEEALAQLPVGAGPFIMVSDSYSNQIVMKKNPTYWQASQGLPYLDNLTFKSVSGDEAAYEAMLAGEGQVYTDMSTPQLLTESAQHFNVLNQLGTSPYDLQLNTAVAPFNNPKARAGDLRDDQLRADPGEHLQERVPGRPGLHRPRRHLLPAEGPRLPGLQPDAGQAAGAAVRPGQGDDRPRHDLLSPVAAETTQALAQEWAAFGVKTTLHSYPLNALIQAFTANGGKSWQSMIQTAGAYDPAGGVGVGFRFNSTSPFSGVHDPKLDSILAQAAGSSDLGTRCPLYNQAAAYIAKNYYGPFYFSFAPANVSVKGVAGPGLTTPLPAVSVTPAILWEDVYYNPSGS